MYTKQHLFWYISVSLLLILFILNLLQPSIYVIELVLVGILSMGVVMKSAAYVIYAISDYSRKTKLSKYFTGFVIVAFSTSLPELSTAIFASIAGKGSLVLGNILGANIIDITVVLGLGAILGKKLKISGKRIASIIIFPIILLALAFDGSLSRIDGLVLLIVFLVYLVGLIRKEKEAHKIVKDVPLRLIWKDILIFGFALGALLLAARWLVFAAIEISYIFELPPFFIGLLVVSLGTTLPELAVQLKSIKRGATSIGFGNILGSFVTNICLILAVGALIQPIQFAFSSFFSPFIFMMIAIVLGVYFMHDKTITWKEGLLLIVIYLIFVVTQIVQQVL